MASFLDRLLGRTDAGGQAAQIQGGFSKQAIEELKRQFGITQEDLAPFVEAGQEALPSVIEGTTAAGLDARIAELLDTEVFGSLVGERGRAAEGALAAGGLTRSGTAIKEAAAIPTDIALVLEGLLSGRQANLAGSGQNAALGLGSLGATSSANIAELLNLQGQVAGQGVITDATARAAADENLVNIATTAASIFFSDPRLKKDVSRIGSIGGLGLYVWNWIEGAKGTIVEKCSTTGFMADEVQDRYPQHVNMFGGFKTIDYPALIDELGGA